MSLLVIFIAGGALVIGLVLGYYLRLIISLGKKGSMELEIKHMMVSAKEQAQRIVDEGKKKAEEKAEELHQEEKKKEIEFKKTEERLIKKEGLLDARQTEIDKEVENVKLKVEEIKKIKFPEFLTLSLKQTPHTNNFSNYFKNPFSVKNLQPLPKTE